MSTTVGTDLEILESLDFEAVVECEVKFDVCAVEADVLIVCRVCKHGTPSCSACFARSRERAGMLLAVFGGAVFCAHCDTQAPSFDRLWFTMPVKAG